MQIRKITIGELWANCYILISDGEVMVVDPGEESEKIIRNIKKYTNKIKYIVLTHYHFDHTDAVMDVKNSVGGRILACQADAEYLNFEIDDFIDDGDKIKIGNESIKVIHTPGHSAGSICLLGDKFILTGDTLFAGTYGRTDLPGGNQKEMNGSLKKLSKIISSGTEVYPGHGEKFIKK